MGGTKGPEAANGICKTGFDIGLDTGGWYAPGFYFAQNVTVSHGYTRNDWHINSKHSGMRVMLLCRVLGGNLRKVQHLPSAEEKEALTASCLGPGGTFGAGSEFHTVFGGGEEYVAMHRDQVYPEFVVIYDQGRHAEPGLGCTLS